MISIYFYSKIFKNVYRSVSYIELQQNLGNTIMPDMNFGMISIFQKLRPKSISFQCAKFWMLPAFCVVVDDTKDRATARYPGRGGLSAGSARHWLLSGWRCDCRRASCIPVAWVTHATPPWLHRETNFCAVPRASYQCDSNVTWKCFFFSEKTDVSRFSLLVGHWTRSFLRVAGPLLPRRMQNRPYSVSY